MAELIDKEVIPARAAETIYTLRFNEKEANFLVQICRSNITIPREFYKESEKEFKAMQTLFDDIRVAFRPQESRST